MAEDIKNLIEKIQQEGVKIAEDKAKEIESRAHKEAERLLQEAKAKAEKLTNDANEQISKMQVKQKTLLAQAGRDLLLVLRKEINASLDKLISLEVKNTLTPDVLTKIIVELIKGYGGKSEGQIAVSLRKEDLELLEKGLLHKLQEEVKKGLTLKAEDDIQGGFVISYDNGKSQYDFSDKALAEYIGSYLKPKLAEIFKEAAAK
ncbi:MAG: V-type ATP synthase subunit E family protein [Patescibacteria group bacterium]